jgi:uncharacterized lipoprotein YmbA
VPERLNRAQFVVADGDAGGVKMLDLSRWSAPLPDELRDALSQQFRRSWAPWIPISRACPKWSRLRVTTEVVRLDAMGQRAAATIAWTVRRLPDGKVLSGRTEADLPAPGRSTAW